MWTVPRKRTGTANMNLSTFLFFFSGHEFRPINDQFRPHDLLCWVTSLMVVQVFFFFRQFDRQFFGAYLISSILLIWFKNFCLYIANLAIGLVYSVVIDAELHGKVKLSLCWTKHHAMKTYWWSGGIVPHILDLGTRWRWVVSFTPRPLYPQGKSPWYQLDRMLSGLHSWSGHGVKEKNSLPPPEIEPRPSARPARNQSLYRLSYPGCLEVSKTFNSVVEIRG
jgi:hypothetical protein